MLDPQHAVAVRDSRRIRVTILVGQSDEIRIVVAHRGRATNSAGITRNLGRILVAFRRSGSPKACLRKRTGPGPRSGSLRVIAIARTASSAMPTIPASANAVLFAALVGKRRISRRGASSRRGVGGFSMTDSPFSIDVLAPIDRGFLLRPLRRGGRAGGPAPEKSGGSRRRAPGRSGRQRVVGLRASNPSTRPYGVLCTRASSVGIISLWLARRAAGSLIPQAIRNPLSPHGTTGVLAGSIATDVPAVVAGDARHEAAARRARVRRETTRSARCRDSRRAGPESFTGRSGLLAARSGTSRPRRAGPRRAACRRAAPRSSGRSRGRAPDHPRPSSTARAARRSARRPRARSRGRCLRR